MEDENDGVKPNDNVVSNNVQSGDEPLETETVPSEGQDGQSAHVPLNQPDPVGDFASAAAGPSAPDSTEAADSRNAADVSSETYSPITGASPVPDAPGAVRPDNSRPAESQDSSLDPVAVRSSAGRAMREGRFSEAADALTELVGTYRDDGEAWRLLGGSLSSLGDTDAAVVAFTEAMRCRPGEARSHYNLALALERAGRTDAAKDRYGACLAIDPTHAGALERRSLLGTQAMSEAAALPKDTVPSPAAQTESGAAAPPTQGPSERRLQPPVPPSRYEHADAAPQNQRSSRWGETPRPSPADRGSEARQRPLQPRPTSAAEAELQSSTIFALGIVGLAGGLTCGLPILISPVAWMMANQSIERMKKMDEVDPTVKNQLQAGRTMGIVGTTLLALFVLLVLVLVMIGIAA